MGKEESSPSSIARQIANSGAGAFTEQLMKMTREKTIAPYYLVEYSRMVIDLYKRCYNGDDPSDQELIDAQIKLNLAIDNAKINDLPYDDLESLKCDINLIKYDFL